MGRRIPNCPAGYGYTTPLTDAGKGFSIAFALLGVPTTMLLLTATAQHLALLTHTPLSWLSFHWGWDPRRAARWHLVALLAVVMTTCFLVPAMVFAYLEEAWSFLDAFYFCFISLSTIGLGDYVPGEAPGQPYRALYKVLVTGELVVEWGLWGPRHCLIPGGHLLGSESDPASAWRHCRTVPLPQGSEPTWTQCLSECPHSVPFPGPDRHDAGATDLPPRVGPPRSDRAHLAAPSMPCQPPRGGG